MTPRVCERQWHLLTVAPCHRGRNRDDGEHRTEDWTILKKSLKSPGLMQRGCIQLFPDKKQGSLQLRHSALHDGSRPFRVDLFREPCTLNGVSLGLAPHVPRDQCHAAEQRAQGYCGDTEFERLQPAAGVQVR